MNIIKAIIIAGLIWIIGVAFYSLSFYLTIIDDLELQGSIVLAVIIIPTVWIGTHLFYQWNGSMHGLKVGVTILLTLIFLDGLFTVPLLIIPNGGSYSAFFMNPSFWLIALECLLVVFLYWKSNIQIKQS